MRMGKTLFLKVVAFVPILLFVMIVNYVVDPVHLFSNKSIEKEVVKQNLAGNAVEYFGLTDYDRRFVLKEHGRFFKEKKDVVILGSSRVFMLTPSLFPGRTFFNAGIPMALLNDYIAGYGLFIRKGFVPSVAVIGIDPWIFDEIQAKQTRTWQLLSESYDYVMEKMSQQRRLTVNLADYVPSDMLELFSFSYFHTAFHVAKSEGLKLFSDDQKRLKVTTCKYNEYRTLCANGVVLAAEADRIRSPEDAIILGQGWVAGDAGKQEIFRLDAAQTTLFENFVDFLLRENVKVIFYLPPYSPHMFSFYNGEAKEYPVRYGKPSLDRVEGYLRKVAEKRDIRVVGTYSGAKLGFSEADFFDGWHLKTVEDMASIFRRARYLD